MALKFAAADELKGAVLGTLVFLGTYMALLLFQSMTKFVVLKARRAKEKKDGKGDHASFAELKYYNRDVLALAGDRAVGNTLEQLVTFLPLLWLHALFVDPSLSFRIGLVYSLSRIVYPFLFLLNGFNPMVFLSTIPGYAVQTYLAYKLVVASI